jgi:putative Mn2+ efflux pump MntP
MANPKKGNSLVWGIILIIIGGVILLEQLDIDVFDQVWRFWPVILIIWGANKLWLGLKEKNERSETPGPDKGHEI